MVIQRLIRGTTDRPQEIYFAHGTSLYVKRDLVQNLLHRKRKRDLRHRFQFGWMGTPELANSIAMSELTVPNLLVLNSTTSHHHMPEDDPVLMTPEAVSNFLDLIHSQQAPVGLGLKLLDAQITLTQPNYLICCRLFLIDCLMHCPKNINHVVPKF